MLNVDDLEKEVGKGRQHEKLKEQRCQR